MEKSDYGLFVLRLGVGIFFLIFGILKFVGHGPILNMVYQMFDKGMAVSDYIYFLGGVQVLLGIMVIIGWKNRLASTILALMQVLTILALMQFSTVIIAMPKVIEPLKFTEVMLPNFLFFGAIPILGALIALILVGPGKISLDKK